MNKLQLLKNPYIGEKSLKLSKVIPSRSINLATSGTAYNQLLSFDLETVRQHNGLYRMFIKVSDISYTPDQSTPYTFSFENYFIYLIKKLRLRTKNDTTLMEYDYRYTLKRINENENNYWGELYDDLTSFTNTTTTAYVPLFMFFDQTKPLDLRKIEPLELLVEINDLSSTFESGFVAPNDEFDLVSARFDLVCLFEDSIEKGPLMNIGDLTLYPPMPSKLTESYDIFYEPIVSVSNATTVKVLLECPYPCYAIHALAQGSLMTTFGSITNAKLESANEVIFDLDSNIVKLHQPTAEGTFFSYQFVSGDLMDKFGTKKYDPKASGLIDFSSSFYPAYLELTFSTAFTGSVVVFYEYVSDLEVKNSTIVRTATGKFKIR